MCIPPQLKKKKESWGSYIPIRKHFRGIEMIRAKEGHYNMIKRINSPRRRNNPTPNNGALKYRKEKLIDLKKEIDKSTIILGHFNTLLWEMGRKGRQKRVMWYRRNVIKRTLPNTLI